MINQKKRKKTKFNFKSELNKTNQQNELYDSKRFVEKPLFSKQDINYSFPKHFLNSEIDNKNIHHRKNNYKLKTKDLAFKKKSMRYFGLNKSCMLQRNQNKSKYFQKIFSEKMGISLFNLKILQKYQNVILVQIL